MVVKILTLASMLLLHVKEELPSHRWKCAYTCIHLPPLALALALASRLNGQDSVHTHRASDETPFLGALLSIQSFLREVDVRHQLQKKN